MMIPCLYSFLLTVLRTLAVELPANKNVPEPFLIENRVRVQPWQTFLPVGNRGLSDCPLDRSLTVLRTAALFESCTVLALT